MITYATKNIKRRIVGYSETEQDLKIRERNKPDQKLRRCTCTSSFIVWLLVLMKGKQKKRFCRR